MLIDPHVFNIVNISTVLITTTYLLQVFAQRLWDVLTGAESTEYLREIPVIASFTYYAFTIFLARILRTSMRRILPAPFKDFAGITGKIFYLVLLRVCMGIHSQQNIFE